MSAIRICNVWSSGSPSLRAKHCQFWQQICYQQKTQGHIEIYKGKLLQKSLLLTFLSFLFNKTVYTEADANVATTCNSSGNDLLGFYIRRHLLEEDSILIHLVRYDLSRFGRYGCFGPLEGQDIFWRVYQSFEYSSRSSDAQANAFCQSCRDIDILAIVHLAVIHQ